MITTSKPRKLKTNDENTPTRFGKIFSGDFLLDTKLTRWYPYFIMLFTISLIIVNVIIYLLTYPNINLISVM